MNSHLRKSRALLRHPLCERLEPRVLLAAADVLPEVDSPLIASPDVDSLLLTASPDVIASTAVDSPLLTASPDAIASPAVDSPLSTASPAEVSSAELAESATVSEMDPDAPSIVLPLNTIPNFAAQPTVWNIQSGSWSDASIWSSGQAPSLDDVVRIKDGTEVIYDQVSDVALDTIGVEPGALFKFSQTTDTRLKLSNLIVFEGGTLEIGTPESPIPEQITAEIIIADKPLDLVNDPFQFGNAILGFGKVTIHGADKNMTWVRLAEEPLAGQTQLVLEQEVVGWRVGDTVAIPDTRQVPAGLFKNFVEKIGSQWEEATIQSISGKVITLDQALAYDHTGARDNNGVLTYLPHVALIDRNVIIRSENPDGTRGHVLFANRAEVDIRYARFSELGRTKQDVLSDDTIIEGYFLNQSDTRFAGEVYKVRFSQGRATFDVTGVMPRGLTGTFDGVDLVIFNQDGQIRDVSLIESEIQNDGTIFLTANDNANDRIFELVSKDGEVTSRFAKPKDATITVLNEMPIMTFRKETNIELSTVRDWEVVHLGTNPISRYSLHLHRVAGAENPDNEGYQFKLIGNTVDGGLKWSYVLHGTSYGLVQDNVAYDGGGAGFVTEDGTEIENEFTNNFSLVMQGTGGDGKSGTKKNQNNFGREGSGFWSRSTGNSFVGNVSANATGSGFTFSGYALRARVLPAFRGALKFLPGQGVPVENNPSAVFRNNEIYSLTADGIWSAHASGAKSGLRRENVNLFEDTVIWNVHRNAIEFYHTSQMKIVGFDILFDNSEFWLGNKLSKATIGINVTDYSNNTLEIRDGRVSGAVTGIWNASANDGGSEDEQERIPAIIENVELSNYRNIAVSPSAASRGSGLEIRNVRFRKLNVQTDSTLQRYNIIMQHTVRKSGQKIYNAPTIVHVYDYDGVPGDDFRLYFYEQAADFVNPVTGISNQESWLSDGVAAAGQIATSNEQREGIYGLLDTSFSLRPEIVIQVVDVTATGATLEISTSEPTTLFLEYFAKKQELEAITLHFEEASDTRQITIEDLDPSRTYFATVRALSESQFINVREVQFKTAKLPRVPTAASSVELPLPILQNPEALADVNDAGQITPARALVTESKPDNSDTYLIASSQSSEQTLNYLGDQVSSTENLDKVFEEEGFLLAYIDTEFLITA